MFTQLEALVGSFTNHIKARHKHNVSTARAQSLLELSGSFGDLGTFIPIFIALVSSGQVSAPATLVFSGIANILTGLVFGIPLPVQPMKAIAAIALQKDLSSGEIAGAGLFVAAMVGFLSVLGLLDWFLGVIPVPVVKGIQVGAGMSLMLSAFTNFPLKFQGTSEFGVQAGLLLVNLVFLLIFTIYPRLPFVLIIVMLSIIAALSAASGPSTVVSIWQPELFVPTGSEFLSGTITAGLGQLPLTTLNSIIAVVVLAQDLFPTMHDENSLPSATQIGLSVTLMNVVALWFRSMPFCHGSGGLAAQYRFGARSGASVIMLGLIKLMLGLFAADFVTSWCRIFSTSGAVVLGILMFLAGLELAKMGQNLNSRGASDLWEDRSETERAGQHPSGPRLNLTAALDVKVKDISNEERMGRWTIMVVTIGTLLGAKNDGIGFLAGMAVHWAHKMKDWHSRRTSDRIVLE